jgi:hypothetical protein
MGIIRKLSASWHKENSMTILLITLSFYLFIFAPIAKADSTGRIISGIFFTLLIISGVASVANERKYKIFNVVFASLAFLSKWFATILHSDKQIFGDLFLILYFILLAFVISKHIFNNTKISIHKIMGSVILYLIIGMVFAYIFSIIEMFANGSFLMAQRRPDETYESKFVYYSFITLTTTGYGDITPVSTIARSITVIEALIGQLFPAILIARLVSAEIATRMYRAEHKDE